MSLPERYWAKVIKTPGCWYWVGALSDGGYGRYDDGHGRIRSAHLAIWEDTHGPLPHRLGLLHACDEASCVNPADLSAGTQAQNQAQMAARHRTANQWAFGLGDTRGPAGRARAIRAALADGYHPAALAEAIAAGDVHRHQLRLEL